MLVLSRKSGQKIHIGSDVVVTIVDVSGKFTRIGIAAPEHINILRGEVKEQIERENQLAAAMSARMSGLKQLGSMFGKKTKDQDDD